MRKEKKKRGEGNLKRKKIGHGKLLIQHRVGRARAKDSYFFRCGSAGGVFHVLSTQRGVCAQTSDLKGQYMIQIFRKIP